VDLRVKKGERGFVWIKKKIVRNERIQEKNL